MAIFRRLRTLLVLGSSLLIFISILYAPGPAMAQISNSSLNDSSLKLTRDTEPGTDTLKFSEDPPENQQSADAPKPPTGPGCSARGFVRDTWTETSQFGRGLKAVPRNAVRPGNLLWELPVLAATGVLIAKVDRPADRRIQSKSLQHTASQWSNVGIGLELGSAALAYGLGCGKHNSYLRDTGFKALAAMAAAGATVSILKFAFDREFPTTRGGAGKFWGGGRSFPSGHSATSFAFAAVMAHRYPQNKWLKWGSYALATGVSLSRYPAKKHFPSDILIGATLGYVTGTYLAGH